MVLQISWIGDGRLGVPVNAKKGKVMRYEAVRLRNVNNITGGENVLVCGVGDFVHVANPDDDNRPFVARVADLWEDKKSGEQMFTAQWCYRREDLPSDCTVEGKGIGKNEVFLAQHCDNNPVASILETIHICASSVHAGRLLTFTTPLITDTICIGHTVDDGFRSNDNNIWHQDRKTSNALKAEYNCSRRFDVRKHLVSHLTKDDLDTLSKCLYSKRTKALVMQTTPEAILARIQLSELASVILSNITPPDQQKTPRPLRSGQQSLGQADGGSRKRPRLNHEQMESLDSHAPVAESVEENSGTKNRSQEETAGFLQKSITQLDASPQSSNGACASPRSLFEADDHVSEPPQEAEATPIVSENAVTCRICLIQ